jgi:hypothetical protein
MDSRNSTNPRLIPVPSSAAVITLFDCQTDETMNVEQFEQLRQPKLMSLP